MNRYEKYNPEAVHRAIVEELMQRYTVPQVESLHGFPNYPMSPRTPMDQGELLLMLSPEAPYFNSPLGIFARLSDTERRTLAELAQQVRTASTPEDEYTATEGLRAALAAMSFPENWIRMVLPKRREPVFKSKEKLPEGGKPKYGESLPHNFRESACRFYSAPDGDPDGNQGGFTE